MNISWIIPPVLGGIIGYITNDVAIKMLFHPYRPIFIGNFHVPFTPGLIPQQKDRIAESIGKMISTHLLDSNTLKNALLSDEMIEKLRERIHVFFKKLRNDERTLEQALLSNDEKHNVIKEYFEKIKKSGADFILKRIISENMGSYIARKVLDETDRKLGSFMSGKIAKLGIANLIGSIINEKICEKLPEMVYNEINKLEEQILSLRLSDICSKNEGHLEFIEEEMTDIYRKMLEKKF